MKLPENMIKDIIHALTPLNPVKVILFGSYAWGEPHKHSDIDLYIVMNDDFIPANFNEKSKLYITVSNAIDELYEKSPFDLIVHTKPMHDRFLAIDSMFSRKLIRDGKRLL